LFWTFQDRTQEEFGQEGNVTDDVNGVNDIDGDIDGDGYHMNGANDVDNNIDVDEMDLF
jgi:hypothetical protein